MAEKAKARSYKGSGTVFKAVVNGETVWRAALTVRTDDDKRRIITGTSGDRATAIQRRDRLHRKWLVKQGKADQSILRDDDAVSWTVEEWLNKWAEEQTDDKIQANTRQRNRSLIKNHINPHIGKKRLRSLTETDIQKLLRDTLPLKKAADNTPLLGSSPLRSIYYILKVALKEAERLEIIDKHPMRYMTAPRKSTKTELRLSERLQDLPKIMDYLSKHPDENAHWILSFYGLRASERLGLEWSSITNLHTNLKRPAVLIINRQLYNNSENHTLSIKRQTKTEAGTRSIPLPEEVRLILINHKQKQQIQKQTSEWNPKDEFKNLIYTTRTGNAIRQAKDNTRWRALLKACEVEPLRGHDMRHMTASWLAQTGTPAEVAKSILGHSSVAMTSYYTHISNAAKDEALKKLSGGYSTHTANFRKGEEAEYRVSMIKDVSIQGLLKEL